MLRKIIAIIVLGMFFIIPFQVQAEELEKSGGGLLSNTGDQLLGATEKLVNTVHTTVQDVEKAIPVLKPGIDVVSEVEKITLPIVEDVVIGATDTTETVLTKVVEGVDETVQTLPVTPVVTPILSTTTETLSEVASDVQTVVKSSEDTVKSVVDIVIEDKSENSIEVSPNVQSTESLSPVATNTNLNTSSKTEELPPIVETKTPIDVDVVIEPVKEEITPEKEAAEVDLKGPEKMNAAFETNMEVDDKKNAQISPMKIITETIQEQDVTVPVNPTIPLGPNPKMTMTSEGTWNGQGNTFSSGVSLLSTGSDVFHGLLPSEEMLKDLTKKKWYHKNSYAVIQWIHTPLRKPPVLTPFLYVI